MTRLAGSTRGFADGPAMSAKFSGPIDVASDVGGNIFVADGKNHRIRRIDSITRDVSTVAGNGTHAELDGVGTAAQFNDPFGLKVFNGTILVADFYGGTVRRIGINPIQIYKLQFTNLQFIFHLLYSDHLPDQWQCITWWFTM